MSDWTFSSMLGQGDPDAAAAAGLFGMCCFLGFFMLFAMLPMVFVIIGQWKVFTKAGKPGWASIIPIYNVMVMAEIAGKEAVYGLLVLIPVVGIYFAFVILLDMARQFGKDAGYAIGLLLVPFIFWPMLGFGSAQYRGGGRPAPQGGGSSGGAGGNWGQQNKGW